MLNKNNNFQIGFNSSLNLKFIGAIVVFLCYSLLINGQIKDIGLPFVKNYTRDYYGAGTQNWDIAQDENGFMYFGNNEGVLRFDGHNWTLFKLPNKSIVRCLLYEDEKLYVAGYEEFGYFEYNSVGEFNYHSITEQLAYKPGTLAEIWRIHSTNYGLVFQSYEKIVLYTEEEIIQIEPKSTFGFSFHVDGNLFVVDKLHGLYVLQDKSLNPVFLHSTFFNNNEVNFMFSTKKGGYLMGTSNKGIFEYDGKTIEPWNAKVNELFLKDQVYSAIELEQDQLAIGTIQNGVIVINKEGVILQHLNRFKGLQNNTVLSLYLDNYENLWLGLDNGIDYVEISNPITALNYCFNIETAYVSVVYEGMLYVGTNQGLFVRELDEIFTSYLFNSGFKLVENTKGQVWNLKIIDNALFCGHNYGTFIVKGNKAQQISDIPGGWDYTSVPGYNDLLLAGNYTGLELFQKSDSETKPWTSLGKVKGIDLSCKNIKFDSDGALWVTHDYEGLIKVKFSDDYRTVKGNVIYSNTHGLPEKPYSLSEIDNKLYFNTLEGFYSYKKQTNRFSLDNTAIVSFEDIESPAKLSEDKFGDVWFFNLNAMGVYRLQEDASYSKISIPFRRVKEQFLSSGFEHVNVYDNKNVFIAGQHGLLHYNPEKAKDFNKEYNCYINDIELKSESGDTTIFKLYGTNIDQREGTQNLVPYKFNSVLFHFFSPFYEAIESNEYSFRLKGFDAQWSQWTNRTLKEYTNLREGEYVFEVKARNIYNKESRVASFTFEVAPPFYRSIYAFGIYFLLLLVFVGMVIMYFKVKLEKARKLEKIKHQQVLEVRESEFEEAAKETEATIEKLKTDKLKNEMRYKNMELANATMHLIQKNKFLTKVKGELMGIWSEAKVESVRTDIKQIVKRIDRDFKNEQQWKLFDRYFDEVHQDFIARLKEKHPVLTPNDLRLCAYLKMNLTTKEIAPLLNISIRGLEISRYRLRKKMDLTREVNLTDYILNI